MATGDTTDFAARIKRLLPRRWTADVTPTLDGVLAGFGSAWALLYDLNTYARAQIRLLTTSGAFLDMKALDLFGTRLMRRVPETDAALRGRMLKELFRPRNTRAALIQVVTDTTGKPPVIVETFWPPDIGGWTHGGVWCGLAYYSGSNLGSGYWGNATAVVGQFFLTVHRAAPAGIQNATGYESLALGSTVGGYGIGSIGYFDVGLFTFPVLDADIYAAINSVRPAGVTIWTAIVP